LFFEYGITVAVFFLDAWFVGVLVTAMQNGHWIILDELNLAPTDVLEALNRVSILFYFFIYMMHLAFYTLLHEVTLHGWTTGHRCGTNSFPAL